MQPARLNIRRKARKRLERTALGWLVLRRVPDSGKEASEDLLLVSALALK